MRPSMAAGRDTVQLAAGATREITFRLDRVGNFFYWAALKGLSSFEERYWLDSQLTGALVVDSAGAPPPSAQERVWLITEWFYQPKGVRLFESALTFNGKAWPYNERLTFAQNDSVHFRVINAAAVEHPLHLHGFYFRVARHGGTHADTVVVVHAAVAEHADHSNRRIAVALVLALDAGELGLPLSLRGSRWRDRESP
jgi:FtsP/CotA-like multicopper oxidase with cupredoxin domain